MSSLSTTLPIGPLSLIATYAGNPSFARINSEWRHALDYGSLLQSYRSDPLLAQYIPQEDQLPMQRVQETYRAITERADTPQVRWLVEQLGPMEPLCLQPIARVIEEVDANLVRFFDQIVEQLGLEELFPEELPEARGTVAQQAAAIRQWMRQQPQDDWRAWSSGAVLTFSSMTILPPEIGYLTELRELYLGEENQLRCLPPEIENLQDLNTLNLAENQLRVIPPPIFRLPQLRNLNLSGNHLTELSQNVGVLNQLESLEVARNELETVHPNALRQLHRLTKLDLSGNRLTELSLGQLTSLETLDLSGNQLKEILPEIFTFTGLKSLSFAENRIETLSGAIGNLSQLGLLDLSGNALTYLPEQVSLLIQLKTLYVERNELTAVHQRVLANHSTLETVDFSENHLATIFIGQLPSLRELNLSKNDFGIVPSGIFDLKRLSILDMSDNAIQFLPQEIPEHALWCLKAIKFGHNLLSEIPPWFYDRPLQVLDLSHNLLSEIPSEISRCKWLESLSFSHNRLQQLSKEIGDLSRLKTLDVSANRLRSFPEQIGRLVWLQILDASCNSLEKLPRTVGKMRNLRNLILFQNCIKTVPEEIANLERLTILDLAANRLREFPNPIFHLHRLKKLDLSFHPSLVVILDRFPRAFPELTNFNAREAVAKKV